MNSNNEITHHGRIVDITPELTTVEIISESACGSCHAKEICGLGDSAVKRIEVPTRGWDNYSPGDEVEVVLKATMGSKAVFIGYGIPLAVLVVTLLVLIVLKVSELAAGLGAIGAVAVYYFIIWLLRDKLKKEYVFNIKS